VKCVDELDEGSFCVVISSVEYTRYEFRKVMALDFGQIDISTLIFSNLHTAYTRKQNPFLTKVSLIYFCIKQCDNVHTSAMENSVLLFSAQQYNIIIIRFYKHNYSQQITGYCNLIIRKHITFLMSALLLL